MRKLRIGLRVMGGILILFFGCRIGTLQAANPPEEKSQEIAMAEARAASNASPAQAEGQEKVDDVELLKGELEAVADSAAQAIERLAKLEKDSAANKKTADNKYKQLGNFTFSGDLRARYEGFFQEGANSRNRERIRLRFNINAKISDEFSGGFSIATGSTDEPVSTNQTLSGFFNRKNFSVDKAFIEYTPKGAKFLKLQAGKFSFPWYRTSLTFDSDLNPEGFAETLSFDLKSSVLKNITLVGFQLPVNESSSGPDSYIVGGQIQTKFQLGSKTKLSLYGAGLSIENADSIAKARGKELNSSLFTNTLVTNSSGTVLGYATKFAYLDAIMKLDIDTHPRFPTMIQFNFVNNMRGSRERSGYWADLMFGKTSAAKDVQFGYSFIRIEKDAVISAWNESDLRQATDVLNHRLLFTYMFHKNITGQITGWFGKKANATPDENYLSRFQVDVIYKF